MSHLKEVNMSYLAHMTFALCTGFRVICAGCCLIYAGACCLVHALIPPFFTVTASTMCKKIRKDLENFPFQP